MTNKEILKEKEEKITELQEYLRLLLTTEVTGLDEMLNDNVGRYHFGESLDHATQLWDFILFLNSVIFDYRSFLHDK